MTTINLHKTEVSMMAQKAGLLANALEVKC